MNNAPTFDQGMRPSKYYASRVDQNKWDILAAGYEKFLDAEKTAKIPKIIHQIWLGTTPPDVLVQFMDWVKRTNPGFEHILWRDEDAAGLDFKNKDLFYRSPNHGQRSDILRYAILERFGGIYLDTDFVGVKSFEGLLGADIFAGMSYDREPYMFNGLIGSTPGNAIIKSLNDISEIKHSEGMDIIRSTGPYFFTDKVQANFNAVEHMVALPVTYFYPYPNFAQDKIHGDEPMKYIKPETICVHLWHSRWN